MVLITSTPFFLETPFSILPTLILAYQNAGHDSAARSSRTQPLARAGFDSPILQPILAFLGPPLLTAWLARKSIL
jgi:hypothetical protein